MAREHKPWWRTDADAHKSDKLVRLPGDAARWAWFTMGCEAKVQRHMGVFADRAYLRFLLGAYARHLPALERNDLVHEWPTPCADCATDYRGTATDGAMVVHNYRRKQVDPTNADRQARFRERHGQSDAESNGDVTSISRAESQSPSPSPSENPDRDGYQVRSDRSDAFEAMQLVEELTGRPFGWGPGSKVADLVIADVADLGLERVTAEYRQVKAEANGSPIDIAGVVYGAHKRLYRIPDAPRQGRATATPKGMVQPVDEIREALRAQ